MAIYGYVAINKRGREMKGSLEGDSVEIVQASLKKQGLIPIEIKEQNLFTRDLNISFGGKPNARDFAVFCRHFTSMVRAGVTIIESLNLLSIQTENKLLAIAIKEIVADVQKGEALADAMANRKIFSNLMVTTVAAGESSGSIDIAFERMADQYEKGAKTQALLKKALIYPCVVAIVAVIVVFVMLVFVIPTYMVMFADMDMDLPAIPKAVVAMSNFMMNYWYILIPLVICIILAIRWFAKTDLGQLTIGRLGLTMPIFSNLIIKTASSQLARTLSTLLTAGVPLIEAVEITSKTMQNVLFKHALQQAKEDIIAGVPLSVPLEQCGLFPPMVYHMIRIGEESGAIEEMLEKLADYYDEEVEMATQSLMAAMEPMIIIVLAVVVGGLVGAVMAPMMSMYQGLDNL